MCPGKRCNDAWAPTRAQPEGPRRFAASGGVARSLQGAGPAPRGRLASHCDSPLRGPGFLPPTLLACTKIVNLAFTPTDVTVVPPVVTGPTDNLVINGVVQKPGKTYRVTVNNFMATGGDGFTTLVGGTAVQGGAQDIGALAAYLVGYKGPAAAYDPTAAVLKKPRVTTVNLP